MMPRSLTSKSLIGGATIGAMALMASSGAVFAQDESPATSPAAAEGGAQAHPLHIHLGTCAELGDVLFPLGVISEDLMVNGSAAAGDEVGTVSGDPVMLNVTVVDASISDLVDSEHAINIHQSEEDIQTYIACGDIGGTLINDTGLAFQILPLNDSGFSGLAWLNETDDGNTTVYTFLTQDAGAGTGAQPEESMAPIDSPMADESPALDASPMADESPALDASPMADESPALDASPMAEDTAAEDTATDDEADVVVTVDVDPSGEPEVEVSE
jgi:hypothetical protein